MREQVAAPPPSSRAGARQTPFARLRRAWDGGIVDVDAHAAVPSLQALEPYLAPHWMEYFVSRGWTEPVGLELVYPRNAPFTCRPEWRPRDGARPASSVQLMRDQLLDPLDVDRAVLSCYHSLESLRHPDAAPALASAINDWLIAEWLERDPRLAASIVVAGHDAAPVAREIDRVGSHPGFVQVLMPARTARLYGDRQWNPAYEAMTRHDLVMGLHLGGRTHAAPTLSGWPSWFIEEYAGEVHVFVAQLTSLIAEGTFQAFPDLRLSVLEAGFAWWPGWAWRLDKDWKGLRREIPWVDIAPSEIVREHVRFSIAPLEVPGPAEMAQILAWLDSDEMLMFATDYPHDHAGDVSAALAYLGRDTSEKLMSDNARSWYRL
ncbi:MAG: amidohydrolase family protein [Solirubrobacteraceae bacterium]